MKNRRQRNRGVTAVLLSLLAVQGTNAEVGSLRPLSTDRPDTTESPYTVDLGRYQFEVEIGSLTRDGGKTSYSVGGVNAKYGVDDLTDVQFILPLFNRLAANSEGFGDLQIRVKRNLWGNDADGSALAVMPFVQLPTGADGISSDEFEGGIIVPFGFSGADGWSYGVQGQLDLVADENGGGYHFAFLTSATAARSLSAQIGAFFEVVAIYSEGVDARSEYYLNAGMTLGVTETLQFDGGIRIGLSNDAEDFTPFFGVSAKF